ncbi:YceD family protein [Bradyrhizobium sp.]|uniref:YceD family protein n=1 Tax=Bradyrhizobium sp. TaxID=376 RepID=UPI003C4CFC4C
MVSQIPDTGLHRDIEADGAARQVMAHLAGVREIASACASFDLALNSGGRIHVVGRVQARVGQTCVVTLDPIDNEIDEAVDLIFAPAEQLPELADLVDETTETDTEIADQPEPFENGVIDLGRLATDVILLAIDPYPRKPGAVFEPQVAASEPEDHPFAALKTLKIDAAKPDAGKPRRR